MTVAVAAPSNPYLALFLQGLESLGPKPSYPSDAWRDYIRRESDFHVLRHKMVAEYSWAIPNDEAIAALVALGPLVEIGAGGGYWAGQIAMAGGDVLAYDLRPPCEHKPEHNDYGHAYQWHPVMYGGAPAAARHPDRALFLCWPPYSNAMASRALRYYQGKALAFVGEGEGGCTADDAFFRMLQKAWREVLAVNIPCWYGMHDGLTIYERI